MEKIQEMFNKDLEELKSKQTVMNNAINETKNSLEEINSRINEQKNELVSWKMIDRVVEITASGQNKEKRMKRNEDSLRDVWDNN